MTSIPKPVILQSVILRPALSRDGALLGKLPAVVHLCGDNLPAKPPTSNPVLTSNSESGNFKYKQTSLPQTTSGAIPKEARGDRATAGNSGLSALPGLPWRYGLRGLTTGCRCESQGQAETNWDPSLASMMGVNAHLGPSIAVVTPSRSTGPHCQQENNCWQRLRLHLWHILIACRKVGSS